MPASCCWQRCGSKGNQADLLAALGEFLDEVVAQQGAEGARTALRRLADDAQAHRSYAEAIDYWSLLQRRWPEEPEAAYGAYRLAECLEAQGHLPDAIAAYRNCITSFPGGEWTGEAYLREAWCCRMARDYATAQQRYTELKLARVGTRYPVEAQWNVAEMLVFQEKYLEAIGAYEELKTMVEPLF